MIQIRGLTLSLVLSLGFAHAVLGQDVCLDGQWEVGEEHEYERQGPVPGLVQNPAEASPGTLWYRRSVTLPEGVWTTATLTLKGARFAPTVYVNGEKVSSTEGGMAPTVHVLRSPAVVPGRTIALEIALKSLNDLDPLDASATPIADRWRTNISSGLWDSVMLHCSGNARIARMTPWTDFEKRSVEVRWTLDDSSTQGAERTAQAAVLDAAGHVVAESGGVAADGGKALIKLGDKCKTWSPDAPNLYRLRLTILEGQKVVDQRETTWGLREFTVDGLGFTLNGHPVHIRSGTVVWPRFLRERDARLVAFDVVWFEKNVVDRLKDLGANGMRFHLGLPPESFMELCDRRGLLVQQEWPFFHGIAASPESLRVQWRDWLDVAMRHPSVVLVHPWNETEKELLAEANAAIADVAADFPPLVVSHRDVIHVHKYWWSMFENLGLYFDSTSDFPKPIMADEFGGNYLGREGEEGLYPKVHESFLRFLGRGHTREMRLQHHTESNALVAEYWRRLGAAGFSPFCIFGSREDGNDWFLGSLENPHPKPVWAALSAAFAPQSVSLEMWNRNFRPGQEVELPLTFFNDGEGVAALKAAVRVVDGDDDRVVSEQTVDASVPAYGTAERSVTVQIPAEEGAWRFEAELLTPVAGVTAPIRSSWRCRSLDIVVPDVLKNGAIGVPADEKELRTLLSSHGLDVTDLDDPKARVLVLSAKSWTAVTESADIRAKLGDAVARGQSVVLLDVGPTDLSRYQEAAKNLEGQPVLGQPITETHNLFAGMQLVFREVTEPESHVHPAEQNSELWEHLPQGATWLWNGLRGGLIVPAYEMDVLGLSSSAFLASWKARGADVAKLQDGAPMHAYELSGYYEFSETANDETAIKALREKVKFLVADAPSLASRIDLAAPITETDLAAAYKESVESSSDFELTALASCGKNLTKTPVVMITLGQGHGRLVLSQLLTQGRLDASRQALKTYELGHDPAAEQLVLNLIALAARP